MESHCDKSNKHLFTATVFIRAVGAIQKAVTENAALDASAVVTGEHSFLAERLASLCVVGLVDRVIGQLWTTEKSFWWR